MFLTFEQSFRFLHLNKTLHDIFSSNLVKLDLDLDPDQHSENLLDPDPHEMNADHSPDLSYLMEIKLLTVLF